MQRESREGGRDQGGAGGQRGRGGSRQGGGGGGVEGGGVVRKVLSNVTQGHPPSGKRTIFSKDKGASYIRFARFLII